MSEKVVIITTMRKGSKRFINKNTYLFQGKELYKYTLADGEKLANKLKCKYYFAHNYKSLTLGNTIIECKFKGDYKDTTYINDIIKDFKIEADIYILLQVTSPLRKFDYEKINEFINNRKYKCGVSLAKLSKGLYYKNNRPVNFNQNYRFTKKLETASLYKESGSFFIFRKCQLKKNHILSSKNKMCFEDKYNIDIDTINDLVKAEKQIGKK